MPAFILLCHVGLSLLYPAAAVRPAIVDGAALEEDVRLETCASRQAWAKQQLAQLIGGAGASESACEWPGIECNPHCEVVEISRSDAKGDVAVLKDMSALRNLSLRRAHGVSGDLDALKSLTSLEWLDLKETSISGDLAALKDLTALQYLELTATRVSGDISALQNMEALRSLFLINSDVEGDVIALRQMTGLEVLDGYGSFLSGTVAALENLTALRILYMQKTQLAGDVAPLRHLSQLQRLDLSDTDVTGDVDRALSPLSFLERLYLYGRPTEGFDTPVRLTGNFSGLQHLKALKQMYIRRTHISGDLRLLQHLTSIEEMDLSETGVVGDVSALASLRSLTKIYLWGNGGVSGELAQLQQLRGLRRLECSYTNVGGQLDSLQSLHSLRRLELSYTQVTGDVAALRRLAKLKQLDLSHTSVSGSLDVLTDLNSLEKVDLSRTQVSGWFTVSWTGCCGKLRKLTLTGSRVGPLGPAWGAPNFSTDRPLFPALQSLEVRFCSLNGPVRDLLLPLAGSAVSSIYARGCNLTGEMVDLQKVEAFVDGAWRHGWHSTLSQSLQVLDISHNRLSSLGSMPATLRLEVSYNGEPLAVSPAVIERVRDSDSDLFFSETQLANPEDLLDLVSATSIILTKEYQAVSEERVHACRGILRPSGLRVTPEKFLPQEMCACRPGYVGWAINCTPCPGNFYSSEFNQRSCQPCPTGSMSPKGSSNVTSCLCDFGSVRSSASGWSCQCPENNALLGHRCVPCSKLHLRCPAPGSVARTAPPQPGYARLRGEGSAAERVYRCLDPARCDSSGCAKGYDGRLCSDCAPGYRASGVRCDVCTRPSPQRMVMLGLGAGGVLLLMGLGAWMVRARGYHLGWSLRAQTSASLLLSQAAVLLQLLQLWAVLGRLARPLLEEDDLELTSWNTSTPSNETDSSGDLLLDYIEALQLTGSELQSFLALQCLFDGQRVRSLFAVVTPLAPLLLLALCGLVELKLHGQGIRAGLKVLTVLFIGGASGAARLLACQQVDGTGKTALDRQSFRPLFPQHLCTEAQWVDVVGWVSAIGYGVFIPCFLALLFAKQHVVMRPSKTLVSVVIGESETGETGTVQLQLQPFDDRQSFKETKALATKRCLVAAAAGYVAVHVQGRATVELKEDLAIVTPSESDAPRGGFSVSSFLEESEEAVRSLPLRRQQLVQMLLERSILEEIAADDRVMLGARQLLCKYASCQYVWMEVCLKIASAALVSVVASKDGLWLSVGITLGMALVMGLAQPFVQPQVNQLQTLCFLCLALAAVGFRFCVLLSRLALLPPLLLLAVTLLRPNSQEALALRLQEELETKLDDSDAAVVTTEQVQFW